MFLVASHLFARHRRLLGVVLLFAAVVLAAGWPGMVASAASGHEVAAGEHAVSSDGQADSQYQWSGHPFAVPNPGQSHQGQPPPVRLALAFGDSAWNSYAADVCDAVVVTGQRAGAGKTAQCSAPPWGSLQVREVRLQI